MTNGSILQQLPSGSRVAVVRIRSLGDSVLTTPAIHLLKQVRPDLKIAVLSESRFAAVWEGNADVDVVLPPEILALRSYRPDLCLNLHGGPRSARLTLLSGARFRAGFAHFPYQIVYNVHIPTAQTILGVTRKVHTAEHAASAIFYLGVTRQEIPRAKLFDTAADLSSMGPVPLHGPYVVIHPIASQPEKTWPAPFFVNVAQHLKRELGLQPVFIAGPGEDVSSFQRWPVAAGASLQQLKTLLAGAAIFLGNDSGPAHMAAAFGTPVVVLFGPSDSITWAPWKTESQILQSDGPIENITEQMVIRAIGRMAVHAYPGDRL